MQNQNILNYKEKKYPNHKTVCVVGSRSGKINTEIFAMVMSGWWVLLGFFPLYFILSIKIKYKDTEYILFYHEKKVSQFPLKKKRSG